MDARGRDVFKSCRATARTSATAIGTIGTIDGIGTTIVVATIGAVGTIGTIDATARRATTRGDAGATWRLRVMRVTKRRPSSA